MIKVIVRIINFNLIYHIIGNMKNADSYYKLTYTIIYY